MKIASLLECETQAEAATSFSPSALTLCRPLSRLTTPSMGQFVTSKAADCSVTSARLSGMHP